MSDLARLKARFKQASAAYGLSANKLSELKSNDCDDQAVSASAPPVVAVAVQSLVNSAKPPGISPKPSVAALSCSHSNAEDAQPLVSLIRPLGVETASHLDIASAGIQRAGISTHHGQRSGISRAALCSSDSSESDAENVATGLGRRQRLRRGDAATFGSMARKASATKSAPVFAAKATKAPEAIVLSDSDYDESGSAERGAGALDISLSHIKRAAMTPAPSISKHRRAAAVRDDDDLSEGTGDDGYDSDGGWLVKDSDEDSEQEDGGDDDEASEGDGGSSWAGRHYASESESGSSEAASDDSAEDEASSGADDGPSAPLPGVFRGIPRCAADLLRGVPATPGRKGAAGASCAGASAVKGPRPESLRDGQTHPATGRVVIVEEEEAAAYGAPRTAPPRIKGARADALTAALFAEYNARVFRSALPHDLPITWNPRLTKTAGLTFTSRRLASSGAVGSGGAGAVAGSDGVVYLARVELSPKVADTPAKLATTLLHELCHAAAWVVDHVSRPPHGPVFRKWAAAASRAYPSRSVTTCHSYAIEYRHVFACAGHAGEGSGSGASGCGARWGRHSKSLDVATARCGQCHGRIVDMGRGTIEAAGEGGGGMGKGYAGSGVAMPHRGGSSAAAPTPSRAPSAYQLFMKAQRPSVAAAHPSWNPAQVLAEVGRMWTAAKAAAGGAGSVSLSSAPVDVDDLGSSLAGISLSVATGAIGGGDAEVIDLTG